MASLKECMKRLGIEGESASFLEQSVTDILAASPEDQRNEHKAVLDVIGGLSIDRRNVLQQVYEALDDDGRAQVFETVKRTKLGQQAADAVPLSQEIAAGAGAPNPPTDQGLIGEGVDKLTEFGAGLRDVEKMLALQANMGGGILPRLGATGIGTVAQIPEFVSMLGNLAGFGTDESGQPSKASLGKTGEAALSLVGGIGSMGLNFPAQAQQYSNDLLMDLGVPRETVENINKYSGSDMLVGGSAPLANFWTDLFDGPNNSITDDQFIEKIQQEVTVSPSRAMDLPSSLVTLGGIKSGVRRLVSGKAAKVAKAAEEAAEAAKVAKAAELSRQDIARLKADRAARGSVSEGVMYADDAGTASLNPDDFTFREAALGKQADIIRRGQEATTGFKSAQEQARLAEIEQGRFLARERLARAEQGTQGNGKLLVDADGTVLSPDDLTFKKIADEKFQESSFQGYPAIEQGVDDALKNLSEVYSVSPEGRSVNAALRRAQAVAEGKKAIDGTSPHYEAAADGSLIQVGVPTKPKAGLKPNKTSRSYMAKAAKNLKNPVIAAIGIYGTANIVDALTNDEPDTFSTEAALNTALLGAIAIAPSRHVTKARTAIGAQLQKIADLSKNFVVMDGKLDITPYTGMMRQLKDLVGDKEMFPNEKYIDKLENLDRKVLQSHGDLSLNMERTVGEFGKKIKEIGFTGKELDAAKQHVVEAGITARLGVDEAKAWLDESGGQVRELSSLTKKELELYHYVRGMFEQGWQELDDLHQATGSKKINKVKDYWTLFASPDVRATIDIPKSPFGMSGRKVADAGFSFEKSGGVPHKLDLDLQKTLERYVTQQKHYVAYSQVVREADALFNAMAKDGVFQNNQKLATRFSRWYSDLAGMTNDGMNPGTRRFMSWLLRNNTVAQLGFNAGTIVAQATSFPMVVNAIGSRWAVKGFSEMMNEMIKHRADPAKSMAFQKSNVLRGRAAESGFGEIFKIIEPKVLSAEKARQLSLTLMRKADLFVARGTWYGGYKKAISMGIEESKAIKYADDLVLKTQGDAASVFAPAIQRRMLGKLITQFATFSMSNFDYLKGEAFKVGQNTLHGNMSKGRAYGAMMEGAIASYLITQIYKELWNTDSRQFDPISAAQEGGVGGVFQNIVDQIPFLSNGKYGGGLLGGPLFNRGEGALEILGGFAKGEAPTVSDALKASGPVLGALGIPTVTIDRMMRQGGNPFPLRQESEGSTPPKRKATRRPKRRRTRD